MARLEEWLEENWERLMGTEYTWRDMRQEIYYFVNEKSKER